MPSSSLCRHPNVCTHACTYIHINTYKQCNKNLKIWCLLYSALIGWRLEKAETAGQTKSCLHPFLFIHRVKLQWAKRGHDHICTEALLGQIKFHLTLLFNFKIPNDKRNFLVNSVCLGKPQPGTRTLRVTLENKAIMIVVSWNVEDQEPKLSGTIFSLS